MKIHDTTPRRLGPILLVSCFNLRLTQRGVTRLARERKLVSLEKAHQAELWWERPPTRWGPGVIFDIRCTGRALYDALDGQGGRAYGERREPPSSTRWMHFEIYIN